MSTPYSELYMQLQETRFWGEGVFVHADEALCLPWLLLADPAPLVSNPMPAPGYFSELNSCFRSFFSSSLNFHFPSGRFCVFISWPCYWSLQNTFVIFFFLSTSLSHVRISLPRFLPPSFQWWYQIVMGQINWINNQDKCNHCYLYAYMYTYIHKSSQPECLSDTGDWGDWYINIRLLIGGCGVCQVNDGTFV